MTRQRVGVVTGGGGGIGGAIAEEMGRAGWFVVTVDPLVTLDGSGQIAAPEETTADRIVAAGGAAMASAASVTDRAALDALFATLSKDHGPLDAVVNVAGITRQSGFAHGAADDWRALLEVHLGGFLNILGAALPHMVEQGEGTILGVTSGSGWRAANAGGYSCAKRVIASLVWQLSR
ncbi:MAG TPA: SDR family NAD(P)-dependent oxidoreductase, partial [Acidimicrobiales bacterium]